MNELEKCKNSMAYFYNNYLRKVGGPIISEDHFEELAKLKSINETVNLISPRNWGKSYHSDKR